MKPAIRTNTVSRSGTCRKSSTTGSADQSRDPCDLSGSSTVRGTISTPWSSGTYLSGVLPADDKVSKVKEDCRDGKTTRKVDVVGLAPVLGLPSRHGQQGRSGLHVVRGSVNTFLAGQDLKGNGVVVIRSAGDIRNKSECPNINHTLDGKPDFPPSLGATLTTCGVKNTRNELEIKLISGGNNLKSISDTKSNTKSYGSDTVLLDSYLSTIAKKNCSSRGGTKRRKTHKELEKFHRTMKVMEKRQEVSTEWMPILAENDSLALEQSARDVSSLVGLSPDPLASVINNTTPVPSTESPSVTSLSSVVTSDQHSVTSSCSTSSANNIMSPISVLSVNNAKLPDSRMHPCRVTSSCIMTSSSSHMVASPGVTSLHSYASSGYSSNGSFCSSQSTTSSCPSTPPSTPGRSSGLDHGPRASDCGRSSPTNTARLPWDQGDRRNPLPEFQWAESEEVWRVMLEKEGQVEYRRDEDWFLRHNDLTPRMRSVLLDWIMEVSEAYRLKRDTYHICVDLIDRYMSLSRDITKSRLQLIGVTALLIASKMEENLPLKTSEVASVTDGSCSEQEILKLEREILETLDWHILPLTMTSWISLYLQTISVQDKQCVKSFLFPKFSQCNYVEVSRLLDLCVLDSTTLRYPYSKLAAAAVYHMFDPQTALAVSGYALEELEECIDWMRDHVRMLRQLPSPNVQHFRRVRHSESHHIQTHSVNLTLLDSCKSVGLQQQQTSQLQLLKSKVQQQQQQPLKKHQQSTLQQQQKQLLQKQQKTIGDLALIPEVPQPTITAIRGCELDSDKDFNLVQNYCRKL